MLIKIKSIEESLISMKNILILIQVYLPLILILVVLGEVFFIYFSPKLLNTKIGIKLQTWSLSKLIYYLITGFLICFLSMILFISLDNKGFVFFQ